MAQAGVMSYAIVDIDVGDIPATIACPADRTGLGLIFRRGERPLDFVMTPLAPREAINREALRTLAGPDVAERALAVALEESFPAPAPLARPPSLTIAICTKDRAQRLARLLEALVPVASASPFASTEILVIDNASVDDQTRLACQGFAGIRYVYETKAGLDFARNAALAGARGDLLAFLDDDVVVDPSWAHGLMRAWLSRPDAGGFTGLVLPYRLDTDAQIAFERRGGFGRGFRRMEVHDDDFDNEGHPVGAGAIGAGCNMAFDRTLLLSLNGFDDALDTGGPLPGGGDLDIFYRVLRSGRPMVYEPSYCVYHEHRETMAQLTRQYWTWGLGFMAFMTKVRRHDPAMGGRQRMLLRWWFLDQVRSLITARRAKCRQDIGFGWAELRGGVTGYFGEYDRSRRRVAAIRKAQA
jgi:glycosyltransferase involved in cell wall biosynthesis